ncbi:MAG: hypothetical protein JXK05_05910 [Campylobacterales bacterium]|nr:hypothetical protein [Campylobacterales bacterium]
MKIIKFVMILFLPVYSFAFNNTYPKDIPNGLAKEVKGKYRIIEHSADKKVWYAYDTNEYKKDNDGVVIYPPFHYYFFLSSWIEHTSLQNEIHHTSFVPELTYIIDNSVKKSNKTNNLTIKSALLKLKNLDKKKEWTFNLIKNYKGENTYLICGNSTQNSNIVGIWFLNKGELFFVNGSAKNLSPKLSTTFDISIDESLDSCKKL